MAHLQQDWDAHGPPAGHLPVAAASDSAPNTSAGRCAFSSADEELEGGGRAAARQAVVAAQESFAAQKDEFVRAVAHNFVQLRQSYWRARIATKRLDDVEGSDAAAGAAAAAAG
eukprot:SAG22_NODE_7424_length_741_cov_1.040498_1_plen_113_part_01